MNQSLIPIITEAHKYCSTLENVRQYEKDEFIRRILSLLPKIYSMFFDIEIEEDFSIMDGEFLRSYVEEDYYNEIRNGVAALMGEDDVFLETFEEDMKYSDTPVAASISESLADIFQPLYDFISIVRESEGQQADLAYSECRGLFREYWSQTLCNVMRALNNLNFKP